MTPIRFADREAAGRTLAHALVGAIAPPLVVIGIPRGGVVVGEPIAARFHAPLTAVFVRKLSLPSAPELAVGSLDEDGHVCIDHETLRQVGGSLRDLSRARERAGTELRHQRARYLAPVVEDRLPEVTVVLVDDGLATGLTMRAALAYLRRHGARRVIAAAPCAAPLAAQTLRQEADGLVCPVVDEGFLAVGAYYVAFDPVSDDEVIAALERSRRRLEAERAD